MLQVTPSRVRAISSQISFDESTMAESKSAPSDWLYGFWLNVHYLETLHMTRFGNCVEVMWENPPGFDSKASGFVYLCLPWLNKVEWHAFQAAPASASAPLETGPHRSRLNSKALGIGKNLTARLSPSKSSPAVEPHSQAAQLSSRIHLRSIPCSVQFRFRI
jgi:hypothetical protein